MDYITLGKLYYKDKANYKAEYTARFSSENAIKLNFFIKKNQAFFVQTAEVAALALQILKIDKRISLLCMRLPGIAISQFSRRCLIDEILLTNKMEGVHSTRREISEVIYELDHKRPNKKKRKRFYGLVAAYHSLLNQEEVLLKFPQDIRNIYDEIVLREVIEDDSNNAPDGKIFRKEMASIHTKTDKEIHRGVYPESAIIEEMTRALEFLQDETVELLYRSAVFHYLLEYIHPFYDGNGRLGRFIVSYLLTKDMEPLLAYRLSYTITENITEYYDAFKTCNDVKNLGDITPFVLMMLSMIKKSAEALEEALSKRLTRLSRYTDFVETLAGADGKRTQQTYYVLVQAGLFAEHGIPTKELEEFLNTSYTTAMKELDGIQKLGLLKKKRVGRENFYSLDLEKLDSMILQAENE